MTALASASTALHALATADLPTLLATREHLRAAVTEAEARGDIESARHHFSDQIAVIRALNQRYPAWNRH